jgi:hypothetical protein
VAAAILGTAGLATLCGLIHSPLPTGAVFWPWSIPTAAPLQLAAGYGAAGAVLLLLARGRAASGESA